MAQNLVELNIVASQSTIRRALHSEGIYGRKAVKKPFISEIKGMVGVMQENIGKNEWRKIIYSDESRFELFQNDSNNWVWRMPGEKYNKKYLSPTVKKSKGIMV